jgi:hypothetical protein
MDEGVPSEVLGSCKRLEADVTFVSWFEGSGRRLHARARLFLRECDREGRGGVLWGPGAE